MEAGLAPGDRRLTLIPEQGNDMQRRNLVHLVVASWHFKP